MMSCVGEPNVNTPALDALAASGTRFDLTYCANPVCVPCRYSLISGYMPHVFAGLEDNRQSRNEILPVIRDYISTPTMGWLLKEAGYDVVFGGKMHVEGPLSYSQEQEETYGFRCLTSDARHELAIESARFLRESHEKPFLLWASFTNPHDICSFLDREIGEPRHFDVAARPPLPANFGTTRNEASWISRFRDGSLGVEKEIELGLNRAYGRVAHKWSEDTWRYYRGVYRHFMEKVDTEIGVVLEALRDSGLEEDTVIIFTSDHGDHDGAHALAMKRSFYEESVHVSMIISHRGATHESYVDAEHLVNNGLDLIPTLCDYAGVQTPIPLKGKSLRGLAEGKDMKRWRDFVVSETVGGRMVRTKRYKYTLYCLDRAEEQLFDMENDPGEMVNVAGEPAYQDVLLDHRKKLTKWTATENDTKGKGYLAMLSGE
jgi:choline-sulfatase/glucosamine-6-phosphate deaminase